MAPRNQEKANFIHWRMHLNPAPNTKTNGPAAARKYYDNQYYKETPDARRAEAALWVAHQAGPPPGGVAPAPAPGPPGALAPALAPAAIAGPAPDPAPAAIAGPAPDPAPAAIAGPAPDPAPAAIAGPAALAATVAPPAPPRQVIEISSDDEPTESGAPAPAVQFGGKHLPEKVPQFGGKSLTKKVTQLSVSGSEGSSSSSVTQGSQMLDYLTRPDKFTKKAKDAFHQRHPPFQDPIWQGGWQKHYLDSGGMGIVYVYVRHEGGKVVDRVAVKDNIVDGTSWTSFQHWFGDVRDLDHREHMEIHCLREIARAGGTKNTLQIRGQQVINERMWYRIYTCFCAHSDLHSLINYDRSQDTHFMEDIPEPAIWSLFNDLVNACLVLQYGAVDVEEAEENWKPIIHRDMKLANVFLDLRGDGDTEFPDYPRARLGDFGLAIRTTNDDPHNPLAYLSAGTEGWRPIEQFRLKSKRTLHRVPGHKLGEKTNVWGIGAIILRLMGRDIDPLEPRYQDESGNLTQDEPLWKENSETAYSEALRNLVRRCVAFRPAVRPTLRHLQRSVPEHTSGANDEADGMRVGGQPVKGENVLRHMKEKEEYKLGFTSSKRPRAR